MANTKFLSIFNDYVKKEKTFKGSKAGGPPKIKPSKLGTVCERKLFYGFNRVEESNSMALKSKRIVLLGDYVEEMLVASLRDKGVLIDYKDPEGKVPIVFGKPNSQFPITAPELHIKSGFIDILAIIDGELWIGDTKSMNDNRYQGLRSGPPVKEFRQLVTYFFVFRKMLKSGAFDHIPELMPFKETGPKGIILWYYNKNDSYGKEFVYLESDIVNEFRTIVNRIKEVECKSIKGILPPKTPEYCGTCEYRTTCDKDELGFTIGEDNIRIPQQKG